ncbi:MAG: metalloprotease PmbA [Gammaproteobacteria bacterium]
MTLAELKETVNKILAMAAEHGATSAEADIGTGNGLSVTARMGEVETVEHQRDKALSVTVYVDHCKGSAGSADFSDKALEETVAAACTIARNTSPDEYAGLLQPQYLAREIPDLDLYHPWDITPEEAVERTIACENEARAMDKRIVNSDGAMLNTYSGSSVYGNSNGFLGGWDWSSHSIDCTLIAEQDGHMQRDGWYSRRRDHNELDEFGNVAREAARRTLARLGARSISTRRVPVIFEAPAAASLFSAFIGAISGGALYRRSSFLLDKKGERVFPEFLRISERPHIKKGIGSAAFDDEGMATRDRDIVSEGILRDYVLSAYSARKLGLEPTGNAGGVHNLMVSHGERGLEELIADMGEGLLITDMIGFGVNQVTGDYSRGAAGFWIENGQIRYPVEEITVAGNLIDMYRNIVAVGSDVDRRGNIQTGSVMIDAMTVAGA